MLVDISKVKTVTIAEVIAYTYDADYTKDFTKSGVYRVMSGSRGEIEEVEYIGDLETKELKFMTKQECVDFLVGDEASKAEREETTVYVDEMYGYGVEEDYVQFGFTEEEFDWYFKVVV